MSEDFGLLYRSTFTGSMVGTSPTVFAVWGYVVANGYGGHVDLNPRLLAAIFGTTVSDIEAAIRLHCAPDPESRSDVDEGRRLRHLGGVSYEVINHDLYKSARALEEKKAYNRRKKQESREKQRSTTEVPIFDLSKKCLTDVDPLLSLYSPSDLISSDPEGVQGEPSRFAPADFAPTEAQRARCRELGHDLEGLVRAFKSNEFNREYTDWERRFSKWIEDQRPPSLKRASGRPPPALLEPSEAERRAAAKHGVDLDAIVAELVRRGVVESLGLGRARELIGEELRRAARLKARGSPAAAAAA